MTVRRIRLEALAEDRLRMLPQREAKLRLTTHQNALRLSKLTVRLVRVECRLAGNASGICFGSRKLFRQQHHLELTGFGSREAWLRQWQSSCSRQIFYVGSKDETAGNQLCQLHGNADRTYSLKIRIPDRLRLPDDRAPLVIDQVTFDYDRAALEAALNAGTALGWRLHRDERGWHAFLSFDHKPAPKTTLDLMYGAVGDDFNVDHLAVTETDAFGNLLHTGRLPLLR
ncbi:hypothetical protein [Paraburkholderia hospita]|uniref:hypothetical protein n=1 Tax=Paraburkholderia hospita TaxID=169430 RepID=UPI003F4FD8F7